MPKTQRLFSTSQHFQGTGEGLPSGSAQYSPGSGQGSSCWGFLRESDLHREA